jgi:hypothetical protein
MLMLLGNLVRVLPRRTLSLLESILITLEGLGMLLILCMLRKSFHISTKYLSSYHNMITLFVLVANTFVYLLLTSIAVDIVRPQ